MPFRDIEVENKTDNFLGEIISKLDLEESVKQNPKNESKFNKLRNKLLNHILKRYFIIMIVIVFILLLLFTSFEISGIYLVTIFMGYIFVLYYPSIKTQKNYDDINKELPYALRHMGIELKSGKGLHDSIITIKDADYGSLSYEFTRVLEEVKFGKTTEAALLEMSHRINSKGLSRAIQQIIGTLRVGGNLANSLEIIAKDISFEMQIKLKEYSQKLNSFILIYTFIAILTPVISLIMLMAGSTVMGDVISTNLLLLIYIVFFPLIVMFMGILIKRLEPKI